ncbi:hypothetical protein MTO96_040220 [Rhipicephalus appendiculatus]
MALSKSYSSHPRINYQRPCTSSEGRLCHVFRDISAWNKFFWTCGLELREPSVGGTVARRRVRSVRGLERAENDPCGGHAGVLFSHASPLLHFCGDTGVDLLAPSAAHMRCVEQEPEFKKA